MKLFPVAAFFAPVFLCGVLAAGCAESLGDGIADDVPDGGALTTDGGTDGTAKDSAVADTAKADTGVKPDTGSTAADTATDDTEFPDFDSGTGDDAGDDAGTVDPDGGTSGGTCTQDSDCPGADACCNGSGTCTTKFFGFICF